MAVTSNIRDSSGLTLKEKQDLLKHIPVRELHEVGFDPGLLDFSFHRDPMTWDTAVVIKNKKTNQAIRRIVPEYMMATTHIPSGMSAGDIYTTALNSNGSYVVGNSNVNWSDIVGNNSTATVHITNNDLTVGGKSLKDFMSQVEERLAILQPAPDLEEEWVELKALRQQYMETEKRIREKMKTWELLNKDAK